MDVGRAIQSLLQELRDDPSEKMTFKLKMSKSQQGGWRETLQAEEVQYLI